MLFALIILAHRFHQPPGQLARCSHTWNDTSCLFIHFISSTVFLSISSFYLGARYPGSLYRCNLQPPPGVKKETAYPECCLVTVSSSSKREPLRAALPLLAFVSRLSEQREGDKGEGVWLHTCQTSFQARGIFEVRSVSSLATSPSAIPRLRFREFRRGGDAGTWVIGERGGDGALWKSYGPIGASGAACGACAAESPVD